jgi:transcription antitermination factor NusG
MEWDLAIITSGTFEWNEWKIASINEKKWLVKMTINLMGRDTPVELEFSQVKVIR